MKKTRVLAFMLAFFLVAGLLAAYADAPLAKKLQISAPTRDMIAAADQSAQMKLTLKAKPSDADVSGVVWSSSDGDVATVNETGTVTAIAGGSVKITAKDTLGGKSASIRLKIWNLPSGVDISVSEKSLKAGKSFKLSAKITPSSKIKKADKTLTWFSSDSSVASVTARGKVTAHSPGEASITVMTVNGLSDVCEITVTE